MYMWGNWWSEQWGGPLLWAKVGWVIVSIWSPLLSPARETYQINYKAAHKMLRTTSGPNLFYLQKIKSRNLLADWLFVIYYDLSIFQLPLCWLKCCKAIYLSLLIVWGSCSVGKVSWYISYLTVIEFPLKRRNKNRRFSPNQPPKSHIFWFQNKDFWW